MKQERAKICVLPPTVANQIAAGEVVERPASVVKELLENALDAGATHVIVDVTFGGLNAITIADNGEGITAAELPLAIQPHATSKIRFLDDLSLIQTMGFRGEALASIASVSKMTLQSKPATQDEAMQLVINGGEMQPIEPCARNQGTTVSVRELFYNAPVRKRFLKSTRTEFLAIERVVRALAFSDMSVGIDFLHHGQRVFLLPAGSTDASRLQRVQKILGKAFVEAAVAFSVTEGGIQVSGWVADETYSRSQADRIWTYVNRRFVNDKLLNHAIRQAYEGLLPPGRYPACLLYVEIDPEAVDVNVHPTKHELRFHQPRLVHDAIRAAIVAQLSRGHGDGSRRQAPGRGLPAERGAASSEEVWHVALGDVSPESAVRNEASGPGEASGRPVRGEASGLRPAACPRDPSTFHHGAYQDYQWIAVSPIYALIHRQQSFFLLDVLRLQQDCLLAQLRQQPLPLPSRTLFVPMHIEVSAADVVHMDVIFSQLAQIGLTLSWVGELHVWVRSLPVHVPHLEMQAFITAVFQQGETLTLDKLLQLLAMHQRIEATAATVLEQQHWLAYLSTGSPDMQRYYLRHLSPELCARWFSESVYA